MPILNLPTDIGDYIVKLKEFFLHNLIDFIQKLEILSPVENYFRYSYAYMMIIPLLPLIYVKEKN